MWQMSRLLHSHHSVYISWFALTLPSRLSSWAIGGSFNIGGMGTVSSSSSWTENPSKNDRINMKHHQTWTFFIFKADSRHMFIWPPPNVRLLQVSWSRVAHVSSITIKRFLSLHRMQSHCDARSLGLTALIFIIAIFTSVELFWELFDPVPYHFGFFYGMLSVSCVVAGTNALIRPNVLEGILAAVVSALISLIGGVGAISLVLHSVIPKVHSIAFVFATKTVLVMIHGVIWVTLSFERCQPRAPVEHRGRQQSENPPILPPMGFIALEDFLRLPSYSEANSDGMPPPYGDVKDDKAPTCGFAVRS